MQTVATNIAGAGAAAVLFAATFLFSRRLRPLLSRFFSQRSLISFGAGTSVAYVFVQLMPEMQESRSAFVKATSIPLPYEGMAVYFLALMGFMGFYGLDNLRTQARDGGNDFSLHLAGFGLYVALMSYLLVHGLELPSAPLGFAAAATAFHFMTVDHLLREEHGAVYDRIGRYVLAGMSLLGWAAGLAFELSAQLLALLTAFVSGAVIMNSTLMELPSDKNGRFLPFLAGGALYGLVLVTFG